MFIFLIALQQRNIRMSLSLPHEQFASPAHTLTHLPLDKMASILQTIFSDALLWMKSFVFWSKFHWSLFLRLKLTKKNTIGLDNGVVPNKQEAVIWTHVDLIHWHIYAALGGDELIYISWWCHQMETFSALLAICAGNSPVPGEFPAQRPVTWSFDVFFDLRLNQLLSKQSWGWWFEMLSHPLWRHCYDFWIFYLLPSSPGAKPSWRMSSWQHPIPVILMSMILTGILWRWCS